MFQMNGDILRLAIYSPQNELRCCSADAVGLLARSLAPEGNLQLRGTGTTGAVVGLASVLALFVPSGLPCYDVESLFFSGSSRDQRTTAAASHDAESFGIQLTDARVRTSEP